jgi:hypothetical protein
MHTKPLPLNEWLEINRLYDVKRDLSRVMFFITDPRKYLPATGKYAMQELKEPALAQFYDELGLSLAKH